MLLSLAAWLSLAAQGSGQETGQIVPPPPLAQPAASIVAEPAGMLIAGCDSDGDGRTTRAELNACIARSFAEADTAHAGSIGYIAYADWALKWLGDRNALPSPFGVDTDQDNRITLAELQAAFTRLFDRFDRDRDGAVTRAELLVIRSGLAGDGPRGAGRRGGGKPR